MDLKEIFKNLCYYDKRNPDYFEGYYSEKPNPCYCTNCLHGVDKLANELLDLRAEIIKTKTQNEKLRKLSNKPFKRKKKARYTKARKVKYTDTTIEEGT